MMHHARVVRAVRPIVGLTLLAVLAGCGSSSTSKPKDVTTSSEARDSACIEVRAGIEAYNTNNFQNVQPHFVKAKVFAKAYATASKGTEADKLLEAIIFFTEVPPDSYAKDVKSSKLFEKYKAVTLGDCEITEDPGQPA